MIKSGNKNTVYVEFVGASGAGKTTIVREIESLLKNKNITCVSRLSFFEASKKSKYKLFWTMLHICRLDFKVIGVLLRWGRKKGRNNALMKAHEYIKLKHVVAKSPNTVALWDSGFVQLFSKMTVAGFMNSELTVPSIEKRLPKNCVIVFLDTSIKEAIERKRERALGWGSQPTIDRLEERIADEEVMKNTYNVQAMQEKVLQELRSKGHKVVRLDGMLSPQENAAILVEHAQEMIYG